MYVVVDRLVDLLARPAVVLPAFRVGARRPVAAGELPAIACTVAVSSVAGRGIGRFIGSKHLPLRRTARVTVADSATGGDFAPGLRTLRLTPPLRRDPAPVTHALTERDVGVTDVSDALAPVAYRLTSAPASATEYRADLAAATVTFGAPQRAGATLELTWWTSEWHEPVESDLMRGTVALELWAADAAAITALSRRVQDRMTERQPSRELGFARLEPARLEAAAAGAHPALAGGSFAAWTQRLEYGFTFEGGTGGEASDGGIIRRIDATLAGEPAEAFTIPLG